jgi:hypothetical protein
LTKDKSSLEKQIQQLKTDLEGAREHAESQTLLNGQLKESNTKLKTQLTQFEQKIIAMEAGIKTI